jgi:hypothetical protein
MNNHVERRRSSGETYVVPAGVYFGATSTYSDGVVFLSCHMFDLSSVVVYVYMIDFVRPIYRVTQSMCAAEDSE